jgi:hypothetical protein
MLRLTHIGGDLPTVPEAKIAKNYYSEAEITSLNHITSLALEFFESQAEQRKPTTIAQFNAKMRELLKLDGRPLIATNDKGRVSKQVAHKKAAEEVNAYNDAIRITREADGERALIELTESIKARQKRGSARKPDMKR